MLFRSAREAAAPLDLDPRDEAPALWRALGVPPGVDVSAAEVPQVRALRAR